MYFKFCVVSKSNPSESHELVFNLVGDKVISVCSCQSELFHKFCRHKMELLSGNIKVLRDKEQFKELESLIDTLRINGFMKTYDSVLSEIVEQENIQKKSKEMVSKLKDKLYEMMK